MRNLNRNDAYSRSRTESFRATLGMRPADNFTAYLTYQYLHASNRQNQQVVGSGNYPSYNTMCLVVDASYCGGNPLVPDTSEISGPPLKANDYRAVSEGEFFIRNKTHIVNLDADWDIGPATLSFVGAYQYSLLRTNRDTDDGNAVPNYIGTSYIRSPYKIWSGELRLTSNNSEGFGWGVGAFYTQQRGTTVVEEKADSFFFPTSVATTPSVLGDVPYLPIGTRVVIANGNSTWSFNANLRYKAGPLKIEGGVRYSIIKSDQPTQLFLNSPGNSFAQFPAFSSGPTDIIPAELQKFTDKPITGGINISYELSSALNLYAAYGHAFRQGSTQVAPPAGVTADLLRTKNEKTDSFEVGLKGALANRRINFSVAAFYQKIDHFLTRLGQTYWEAPSPPASSPNGFDRFNYNGNATIKGVEADINGRVTSDWDVGISASYAHARYDKALLPCNDFDGSGVPNQNGAPTVQGSGNVSYCASNGRLAEVPDFSLSANTEIRFPLGAVTPFVRGLVSYRPGFRSEQADFRYQSRTLLNLYAGLRSEAGWEINLFVKNVLNQKRITNISLGNFVQATASLPYDSGYRLVNTMNPREAGVTINYKF